MTATDNRTARRTFTTAELADILGTTPYKVRKYLRADDRITKVGHGGRYEIPAHFAKVVLIRRFRNWDTPNRDPRPVDSHRRN